MLGLPWGRLSALLLMVISFGVSGLAPRGDTEELEVQNPWIPIRPAELVPAESQRVSMVEAASDLEASATGYGKGQYHKAHKGYKSGYHDKEGYKGHKGHKADKGYKKKHHGDYGKDHKKGYHDKGGKHYKGHDDKHKYYGDEHKGKKGKKGHHYGSKGHHNKGHKDKGFKNVYHKEEYHHSKKYYDDHDVNKYHDKYDDFDSYFKSNKGKDYKGGEYKGHSSQSLATIRSHSGGNVKGSPISPSQLRGSLDRINDITTNLINDVGSKTKNSLPQKNAGQNTNPMRYQRRKLLGVGVNSNERVKFQQELYDEQCQVFDLRMIRKYLKYCLKHAGDIGNPNENAPSCSEEDLTKIKKYLNFCKKPFFAQASKSDKKQYVKLISIAKKLDRKNFEIEEEEVYHSAEVCNVEDLRQMKVYLKGCYTGKENSEIQRPDCDLENFQKSFDYLTNCQATFFLEASKRDKKQYDSLVSLVSALISKEQEVEMIRLREIEEARKECQVADLREAHKYIKECTKLLQNQDSKKMQGAQVCQSSHMLEINQYLLRCEQFFVHNVPDRDKQKYMDLIFASENLGMKSESMDKTDQVEQIECKISDLRKVPSYLMSCDKSQSCEINQLTKVHEFLLACEKFFLSSAKKRDVNKYQNLVLKSEMLSTKESIDQWRENKEDERKHMEAVCKIHVLRKVPKFLQQCRKSRDCKIKKLLKIQDFLSHCENFFTLASSPKDRGKYKKFQNISAKLINETKSRGRRTREVKTTRQLKCNKSDLRKIPNYIDGCLKNNDCKSQQLKKVYQFLFICEIPFCRSASKKDKENYKKLLTISKELSTGRKLSVEKQTKKQNMENENCKIKDLRKIPKYLSRCKTSQNCKQEMTLKIQTFLQTCRHVFTKNASEKNKNEYEELENAAIDLLKPKAKQIKQKPVLVKQKRKNKTEMSICKVKSLRKIPKFLSKCASQKIYNQKRVSKVYDVLKTCKTQFTAKASREDKKKYKMLISDSKRLLKTKKSSNQKLPKEHPGKTCSIRKLKKISSSLNSLKNGKIKSTRVSILNDLMKGKKYLTSCRNTLSKNLSSRNKTKYEKLIKLSKTYISQMIRKYSKKSKEERKKPVSTPTCKVQDLRKANKFLLLCSTNRSRKDQKQTGKTKNMANCGKRAISVKINSFLTSCKKQFLRQASNSDRKQYEKILILSKRYLESKSNKINRTKRSGQIKESNCKVQKLRDIRENLFSCSKKIEKSSVSKNRRKSMQCHKTKIQKIRNYLVKCNRNFLRKASEKEKKKYAYLVTLAVKLSEENGRKSVKRKTKFSCDKQDLEYLETHYKYCKAKERQVRMKISRKKQDRRNRLDSKRKREIAKRMNDKRRLKKQKCYPSKNYSKENEHKSHRSRPNDQNRRGGKHHDKHGKKGHHEKGKYHDDHKGHKGHYEHKGHYGDKSSYGKKGGHKGEYGHDDHKGHGKGHDDHGHGHDHGHGYGHDDHHSHGYGHHGHGYPSYPYPQYGSGKGHGHSDHGGYGSHSNVKPVAASPKVAAPPPVYPVPVYVPAPSTYKIHSPKPTGFYPSPKLVAPQPLVHYPAAASTVHQASASEIKSPQASSFGIQQPKVHTFESFGDFGGFS